MLGEEARMAALGACVCMFPLPSFNPYIEQRRERSETGLRRG